LEAIVKYLMLLYGNPTTREFWAGLTDAQRAEASRGHLALTEQLTESGELIMSSALTDISLTKRVLVRDGRMTTTDGPLAETKEQLAGFYLVDCETIERVLEHAARLPEASMGLIEVRPLLDLGGLEM
jgi:hypothetical protein